MLPLPSSDEARRRAVAWAVAVTADTPLAPKRYERQLLDRYQRGELTIEQVIQLLDTSVYQVLYRSRAVQPFNEEQLLDLLTRARAYNVQHQLTELLLYSDGGFVQVLEGSEEVVRTLYGRIQQDPRHTQVVTISEGPGPGRRFSDWSMGFGRTVEAGTTDALNKLLVPEGVLPPENVGPYLRGLLESFGLNNVDPLSAAAAA